MSLSRKRQHNITNINKMWDMFSASKQKQDSTIHQNCVTVRNSNFEDFGNEWIMPGEFKVLPQAGRNGTNALYIERHTAKELKPVSRKFKLQHNCCYKMGCWVKADICSPGEYRTGASFIMHFKQNDRVMHRIFPHGLIKTGNWTYIEKVFSMFPGTDTCEVQLDLFHGYTGKVWFDSISLELYDKWFIYITAPGTRTLFTDNGMIEIAAYGTAEKNIASRKLYCLAEISGTFGQIKTGTKLISGCGTVDFGKLPEGSAEVKLVLIDSETNKILTSDQFPAKILNAEKRNKNNACWIDLKGRASAAGKPFMPIGLFMGQCPVEDVDIIAQSDFNCLMPYASMSLKPEYKFDGDGRESFPDKYDGESNNSKEKILQVLDYCEKQGLKIIFNLANLYEGRKLNIKKWHGVEGTENILKQVIKDLKDHPALLAWFVNDEIPASMTNELNKRRKLINELDPSHPTWCVSMHFTELHSFTRSCDIMGIDPYPLINGESDIASLEFASSQAAKLKMPQWVVPQIFSWAYYEPIDKMKNAESWNDFRIPSEEEIRTMTLSMAINGAKGFIFYYYPALCNRNIPIENYFSKNWSKVKNVASLLKRLEPYIMSGKAIKQVPIIDATGNVKAAEFVNEHGKSMIVITTERLEKSSCLIRSNKSYESLFGHTVLQASGKYHFSATNISSDVLLEK